MTEKMIKFVLGHLSKKEAGEFIRSMDENPALRDECADLYNKVAVANMAPRDGDAQYAAEKLAELNRTSRMRNYRRSIVPRRRFDWRATAAAAAILIAVNVLIAGWYGRRTVPSDQSIILSSNQEKKVEYRLPDGTIVHLNRGTTLRFPVNYDRKERRVYLDGEAYFEVTHNPRHPFIVETSNQISVQVLGTKFNLEAYARDSVVETTLIEGRVSISLDKENGSREEYILRPREHFRYVTHSQNVELGMTHYDKRAAWMDDVFIFRDDALSEVLRQLSHNFDVDFEMADPSLKAHRFTGTFSNHELSLMLDYIKISSGIDYRIEDRPGRDLIILYDRKPKTKKQPMKDLN